MIWKDYSYIDEKRINTYYEQIASSSTAESAMSSQFSIWPYWVNEDKLVISSEEIQPAYSLYEKAHAVEQYIKHSSQFSSKRHSPQLKARDFVYFEETVLTQKVVLSEKLSLWISENTWLGTEVNRKTHGHLILAEGTKGNDGEVDFHGGWSTYQMISRHENVSLEGVDTNKFSLNPIHVLNSMDFSVSEPKKITALYRVRSTCLDQANGLFISTLAYPLCLSEA